MSGEFTDSTPVEGKGTRMKKQVGSARSIVTAGVGGRCGGMPGGDAHQKRERGSNEGSEENLISFGEKVVWEAWVAGRAFYR